MIAPERRRPRLQFTIGLLMKLVLVCGLLSANVHFILRFESEARLALITLEMIGLPLVLALLVLLLAREGSGKQWLLTFLILPYPAAIALLGLLAVAAGSYAIISGAYMVTAIQPAFVLLGLFFGWLTASMVRQLIPRRCPRCGRRALLPDDRALTLDRADPFFKRNCVACGQPLSRGSPSPGADR